LNSTKFDQFVEFALSGIFKQRILSEIK